MEHWRELTSHTVISTHLDSERRWPIYGVYLRSMNVGYRTKERVHLWCVVSVPSWEIAFHMSKASQGAKTSGTSRGFSLNSAFTRALRLAQNRYPNSEHDLPMDHEDFLLEVDGFGQFYGRSEPGRRLLLIRPWTMTRIPGK